MDASRMQKLLAISLILIALGLLLFVLGLNNIIPFNVTTIVVIIASIFSLVTGIALFADSRG
jgi:phosphatidylglycerophosphate synthase